jgi:hypothetical protein
MAKIANANIEYVRQDFNVDKYNNKINEKGYDIKWSRMLSCPCKKDLTSQSNSNCINCGGTGYFFLDPIEIRAMISNTAFQKNFSHQWTADMQGTAYMTIEAEHKIGWMDKIEVMFAETVFSETRIVEQSNLDLIIKTHYVATKILNAYVYVNDVTPLKVLDVNDFVISGKEIKIISDEILLNDQIGLLYEYNPTYVVIDILNDYRNTIVSKNEPIEKLRKMPLRATIKREHLVLI